MTEASTSTEGPSYLMRAACGLRGSSASRKDRCERLEPQAERVCISAATANRPHSTSGHHQKSEQEGPTGTEGGGGGGSLIDAVVPSASAEFHCAAVSGTRRANSRAARVTLAV
eukprot:CAMPEP_0182831520 /NCGR_PEP_ID=MMETSP0006_2-20121128/19180_1 /TAXON_ID=97485 /ORGANISM="Prymnesium parvum, Strain Texoma1" /LENGTH=113 /DNA_ID=CAMNT_0024959215 /DNA_START=121 /DNA_END=462 /DNA_ORIENTATION=-